MDFVEFVEDLRDKLVESVTCNRPFDDPVDIIIEAEEHLIRTVGVNLNLKEI